jgi:hypothetical protein
MNRAEASARDLEPVGLIYGYLALENIDSLMDMHHIIPSSEEWHASFVILEPDNLFALSPSYPAHAF